MRKARQILGVVLAALSIGAAACEAEVQAPDVTPTDIEGTETPEDDATETPDDEETAGDDGSNSGEDSGSDSG
jgi:hypothetical protein